MESYKSLATVEVYKTDLISQPHIGEPLNLSSPASAVFIDFALVDPPMLEAKTTVKEAVALMEHEHSRVKLVINEIEQLRGIVTHADLVSTHTMRVSAELNIPRRDLTVGDLMTPRKHIRAIQRELIAHASIGHVVETFKAINTAYLLVTNEEGSHITGMFCLRDLQRRNIVSIGSSYRAESFAELYQALRH
jgi:CBS domain containing-hemolysin-like protein